MKKIYRLNRLMALMLVTAGISACDSGGGWEELSSMATGLSCDDSGNMTGKAAVNMFEARAMTADEIDERIEKSGQRACDMYLPARKEGETQREHAEALSKVAGTFSFTGDYECAGENVKFECAN